MKRYASLLPVLLCLGFAGCESFSDATDSIKEKLAARNQPQIRIFAAEPRATYDAARVAIDQMNFRFLRGGAAAGELEAVSIVAAGDSLKSSTQIEMKIRLLPAAEEGGTEVRLWLKEIVEDNSSQNPGFATATPVRDSALYEAYFRYLRQALDTAKKA
jgi:hypothetical protein